LSDFSFEIILLRKENVGCNRENSENDGRYRRETCKLLFFCLALVFAEEGIAGCTADRAGKTALLRALEKNEYNDSDGNENDEPTENVTENCIHNL